MGLIKAHDALARRARTPAVVVSLTPAPVLAVIDPERVALERELHARTEEIAALSEKLSALTKEVVVLSEAVDARDARLTEAEAELTMAVADAEQSGREAGRLEGAEAKDEALQVLEGAAERAIQQLRTDLKGLESLAVALAKAALAKVFGDVDDMEARVARLVRRQLEGLDRTAILEIAVSTLDFGDPEALTALSAGAGLEGLTLQATESLKSGDCRIRLRLGELDVGVGQQWSRLSALLDETLVGGEEG